MSWPSRADRIDHAAVKLLWQQVADDIVQQIKDGELRNGDRLPSDPELAQIYGVARSTTRRAVLELRKQRVLTVLHGRGTYVS